MVISRKKFILQFGVEAAHRVISTGKRLKALASGLSIEKSALSRWARDEHRRIETTDSQDWVPLPRQGELIRLQRELSELQKDNAFLGKVASHFAAKPTDTWSPLCFPESPSCEPERRVNPS